MNSAFATLGTIGGGAAGYYTTRALMESDLAAYERSAQKGLKETSFNNKFEFQEPPLIRDIGGKKILILHEPDEIKEFIESDPSIDIVLHGHTHRHVNKKIKGVKIINPGECAGMLKGKNAIGILNLNDLSFKRIFF